jgi:hypothetical protein
MKLIVIVTVSNHPVCPTCGSTDGHGIDYHKLPTE